MKSYLIFLILISFCACKAQSPIVTIDTRLSNAPNGAYFKDVNNELNKFIGEWKYAVGSIEFTIILQKKTLVYDGEHYEDLLIGEYEFKLNGVVIVNTLPLLDDSFVVGRYHNISGRGIAENEDSPVCNNCFVGERRVVLYFDDPERPYLNAMFTLRFLTGKNPEQITARLIPEDGTMLPTENSPTVMRVPYGNYIMTKQ